MAWSKESRHKRGYGSDWTKLREQILKRDCYLCQCARCTKDGRVTLATEVDHRTPKAQGGTDATDNLQAINKDCHKRKTLEETGRTPRVRIGLDGWPIAE